MQGLVWEGGLPVLTIVAGDVAVPGDKLGSTADLVAGPGCYRAGAEVFASVLGVVRVSPAPEGQEAAKLVEVVRAKQGLQGAAPVLPQIGSIVIAKVPERALAPARALPPRARLRADVPASATPGPSLRGRLAVGMRGPCGGPAGAVCDSRPRCPACSPSLPPGDRPGGQYQRPGREGRDCERRRHSRYPKP